MTFVSQHFLLVFFVFCHVACFTGLYVESLCTNWQPYVHIVIDLHVVPGRDGLSQQMFYGALCSCKFLQNILY